MAAQQDWLGVLIEESLVDATAAELLRTVSRNENHLEREAGRGAFHFRKVAVANDKADEAINAISRALRPGWYFHLVCGDEMMVAYAGRLFRFRRADTAALASARAYGESQGIHAAQLQLERLFDNPHG
jgi:hypothetical protein